ncbi:UrcA family protein [Sphingomonas sp. MMS24-JH45]
MKTLILAALVAATTPLVRRWPKPSAPASPSPPHDLDLSRDHDRRQLDRRIAMAAKAVCGEASSLDVPARRTVARCVDTVRAQALPARDALLARVGGVTLAAR